MYLSLVGLRISVISGAGEWKGNCGDAVRGLAIDPCAASIYGR
jgi:hypothetical protein